MSPDPDDKQLFRDAVRGVKRTKPAPAPPPKPKPRPKARFTRLDEAAVLEESLMPAPGDVFLETGEEMSFRRSGVRDSLLKKLRAGQFRVEEEIDLHGLNLEQARLALREFIHLMVRSGARCVRVIHGKGRRSGHRGPVLKIMVSSVLQRTDAVVAFTSARVVDGGTGAVYVLLK